MLEGLEVAGWSHGLGCTAASNAEAIQSCSLLDSLGRLRAAKSAIKVLFARGFEDTIGLWQNCSGASECHRLCTIPAVRRSRVKQNQKGSPDCAPLIHITA